ncbi:hypothetical protein [Acinetobacter tjernbergiae]|uniref:Uncharacterized protein n=1 Tax=Acinetobacter tjernbergiae DSM 14971 = CIP 107465 TaxID=1120928 RepID=V2UX44_9GAMM|nr:hypothetical protein [Acinetobacter tjernbergiae]ESK53196.1 hypothetical protein F990_03466 [Acinetobacter tjernbergiae DSM 14971 = CIP 107465]
MTDQIDKSFLKEMINVYDLLDPLTKDSVGGVEGCAKNKSDFDKINEIYNKYKDDYELDWSFNSTTLKIQFDHPSGTYSNFDKLLLNSSDRRIIPFSNFYIRDIKQIYLMDEEPSGKVGKYIKIINLYNFLKSNADHINENPIAYSLVFLDKKKLIITDEYEASDLVELRNLDDIISKFSDDVLNPKEKKHIFKKALVGYFGGTSEIKLSDVINQFDKICDYINDELDLYMSNFSYETVKKEVEKDKVDFTIRLNKVFSDIQSQLIGVPVSVILAGANLNLIKSNQNSSVLIFSVDAKNFIIFAGILFYAFTLTILIRNQHNTLAALKDEIDSHKKLLEAKHKAIADKFKGSFEQINNRYEHQKKMLLWIDCAVAIAFGLIFILFFYYSFENSYFSFLIMSFVLMIGLFKFYNNYE